MTPTAPIGSGHLALALCVRCLTSVQRTAARLRDRAASERGDISSNLVWVAGFVLAAILVVGILYAKLSSAAEDIDVSPGV